MKACNRKILELFYKAKHTGRISKPDAIGRVGEDDDGLVIEITCRIIGGVIAEAKFRAFANPNAIAITSLMVDNMIGKTIEDALNLGEDVIIDNLGEFLPEYLEVYDMVRECIKELYDSYLKRKSRNNVVEGKEFDYEKYRASQQVEEDEETEEFDFIKIQRELQLEGSIVTEKKGRGRPRKEVDTSEMVESGEKRGRGRPRKIVDETEIVEIGEKRGRGRPRKIVDETEVVEVGEKRGRGRPRKEVNPNEIVEVGEKRGRGRPRKVVEESEIIEIGEKRGRGRPRKIVDETEVVEIGEKRGRGRPRKEIDPDAIVEVGEKRGRGRPRKEVDTSEIVETGEKRGRGRPRKIVDETEIVEIGEKRGRGRPRKIVDETEVVEIGEKRGRGRPRKEIDLDAIVEVGEKRGRGRPKKEVKYNLPSDLGTVEQDEELEQLINGSSSQSSINQYTNEKLIDADDDSFEADYDLFKSNIRNIFSGKEVSSKAYSHKSNNVENVANASLSSHKAERVEIVDNDNNVIIEEKTENKKSAQTITNPSEQPKRIIIEEVNEEKREFAKPTISSLTRSLNPAGMSAHNTQDIVFASKNVTTTNININVTKTTTSVEDNKATSSDYSHSASISKKEQKVEIGLPNADFVSKDEEIDIEPVNEKSKTQTFADIDNYDDYDMEDYDEEVDASKVKDEAPKGGIEDLLKALLDD